MSSYGAMASYIDSPRRQQTRLSPQPELVTHRLPDSPPIAFRSALWLAVIVCCRRTVCT